MLSPDPRQLRRCQAENPTIGLSEFPEPPLSKWIGYYNAGRPHSASYAGIWVTP